MFLKGFLYFEREVRLVPFFSNSRRAVLALRNHAEIDTAVAAAVLPSRMVGDIMRPALANAHAPKGSLHFNSLPSDAFAAIRHALRIPFLPEAVGKRYGVPEDLSAKSRFFLHLPSHNPTSDQLKGEDPPSEQETCGTRR